MGNTPCEFIVVLLVTASINFRLVMLRIEVVVGVMLKVATLIDLRLVVL